MPYRRDHISSLDYYGRMPQYIITLVKAFTIKLSRLARHFLEQVHPFDYAAILDALANIGPQVLMGYITCTHGDKHFVKPCDVV